MTPAIHRYNSQLGDGISGRSKSHLRFSSLWTCALVISASALGSARATVQELGTQPAVRAAVPLEFNPTGYFDERPLGSSINVATDVPLDASDSPVAANSTTEPGFSDSFIRVELSDDRPELSPRNHVQDSVDTTHVPDPNSVDLWWHPLVSKSIFSNSTESAFLTPDQLIYLAMQSSPEIRAISRDPQIRELQIQEASANFDPELFTKSLYDDRVDPVGNILTTGGLPFLKDNIWSGTTGVRRKLVTGGDIELSQRLGFHNSNSRFFTPQDQGTATLAIDLNQPLLKGSGQCYNRSQILMAQVQTGIAWQKYSTDLQSQLVRVVEAYWDLAFRRAILLQKQQNVARGQAVLDKLEGRRELDSVPSQILRAKAAVTSRKIDLANALRDIENAQVEIRRLVGELTETDPKLVELIPVEPVSVVAESRSIRDLAEIALANRPEIREAVQRVKIGTIQQNMSANELLPELNLIFRTYVSGLQPDTGIGKAWVQQFNNTTPGFAAGLEYSVPYGRRAARSRLSQRALQLARFRDEVEVSVQDVIAETNVAFRRLESAYLTLGAALEAIQSAHADLDYNTRRWEEFALVEGDLSEGQMPVTILDQLLDSQQRLSNAESIYAQAEREFKDAEIGLKRALGIVLTVVPVDLLPTGFQADSPPVYSPHR